MSIKINNMPEYAKSHRFIVVRRLDDGLWFWGAFDDRNKANEVALMMDGGEVIALED